MMVLSADDSLELEEVDDGDKAIAAVEQNPPNVVLLDVRMPGRSGVDVCAAIKEISPSTGIIMLTASDEETDLYESIKSGASGYLLKDGSTYDQVLEAVRLVAGGQSLISPSMATKLLDEFVSMTKSPSPAAQLTARELQVLREVAQGQSNREIAEALFISENTVKNHIRNMLEKLQMKSRMEAAMYAVRATCSTSADTRHLSVEDTRLRRVQVSPLQARRIALAAQGFTRPRPTGPVTSRHLNAVIARLGFFQIDSVNVLQRAHYLPMFSRMGPYDVELLHRAAGRSPRRLFEYWAHEAAFVDVNLRPAFQFRMDSGARMWGSMARIAEEQARLRRVGARRGAGERAADGPRDRARLRPQQGQLGLELVRGQDGAGVPLLQGPGHRGPAQRPFERVYDLPERVLPPQVLAAPPLDPTRRTSSWSGTRRRRSASARPSACATTSASRPSPPRGRSPRWSTTASSCPPRSRAGSGRPTCTPRRTGRARCGPARCSARSTRWSSSAPAPRCCSTSATASRSTCRPQKRVHGYYVLPFLLGDRLVARVDLKADRKAGVLRVHSAWAEPDAPAETADELAAELALMAGWLGLETVSAARRGDLAAQLSTALGVLGAAS